MLFLSISFIYFFLGDLTQANERTKKSFDQIEKELPLTVLDESSGQWLVDRFAGNSTAGIYFYNGPANEVGGLQRPVAVASTPDGSIYAFFRNVGVIRIFEDGWLELIIGTEGTLAEGPIERVKPGIPTYNPKDGLIYLTGDNCIRKLVKNINGELSVEVVAGSPGRAGFDDGDIASATLNEPHNIKIDSAGTIYFLDTPCRFRRIRSGKIETLNQHMCSGESEDGPLESATFNIKEFQTIFGGFDLAGDSVVYVADFGGRKIRKIDLYKMTVTTIAGVNKGNDRYNKNADGPGLTHASFRAGIRFVTWDPVHKALWCGGPDETRLRWYKDGWVKTVIDPSGKRSKWEKEGKNLPGSKMWATYSVVLSIDRMGAAYISAGGGEEGMWRIFQK